MPLAPNVLSVEEAGRVLGIGRTTAYAQARAWLATDGREGFPCRRVDRLIQVYRPALEQWLGFEITWPPPDPAEGEPPVPASVEDCAPPERSPRTHTRRARSRKTLDQPTLF